LLEQKIQEIERDWRGFIQIQLTPAAVENAKGLAKDLALRGADARGIASALLLQSRFAQEDDALVLVTADLELKQAAHSSGLVVIDPNEQGDQPPPLHGSKAEAD
jgi:hypothetical protein